MIELGTVNGKANLPTGRPVSLNGEINLQHRMDLSSSTSANSTILDHTEEVSMNQCSEGATTSEF